MKSPGRSCGPPDRVQSGFSYENVHRASLSDTGFGTSGLTRDVGGEPFVVEERLDQQARTHLHHIALSGKGRHESERMKQQRGTMAEHGPASRTQRWHGSPSPGIATMWGGIDSDRHVSGLCA